MEEHNSHNLNQTTTIKSMMTPVLTNLFNEHIRNNSFTNINNLEPPSPTEVDNSNLSEFVTNTVLYFLTGNKETNPMDQESVIRHQNFNNFVGKILKASSSSTSIILLSLKYIHQLATNLPLHRAAKDSEYRVWISSLILADIFLNDNAYLISSWSQVTGFPTLQIVTMTREFLNSIRFNLFITEEGYSEWLQFLEAVVSSDFDPAGVLMIGHEAQLQQQKMVQAYQQHQQQQQFNQQQQQGFMQAANQMAYHNQDLILLQKQQAHVMISYNQLENYRMMRGLMRRRAM